MNKIDALRREAKRFSESRGHKMGYFKAGSYYKHISISFCKVCGMYVQVNPKPLPNEIEIGGNAVSLNCIKTINSIG